MRRQRLLAVLPLALFACDGDGEDDLLSVTEGEVHAEVSLPGSDFEIDVDANLKVDDATPSIE